MIDLVEELSDKLASSQKELQGAAFRNGYLEAQLEGYKEQIKLLPDYQHKASEAERLQIELLELRTELKGYHKGIWAKFWGWFVGR